MAYSLVQRDLRLHPLGFSDRMRACSSVSSRRKLRCAIWPILTRGACTMKTALTFRAAIAALLPCFAMAGVGEAADDPAAAACHQKDTTVAIMDCLNGLAAQWDKRLNAAYQVALKASESAARKDALIRAERAWLAYRKANCGWYDAQEGTIREVEGADCMLNLTRARAVELEDALKP